MGGEAADAGAVGDARGTGVLVAAEACFAGAAGNVGIAKADFVISVGTKY